MPACFSNEALCWFFTAETLSFNVTFYYICSCKLQNRASWPLPINNLNTNFRSSSDGQAMLKDAKTQTEK